MFWNFLFHMTLLSWKESEDNDPILFKLNIFIMLKVFFPLTISFYRKFLNPQLHSYFYLLRPPRIITWQPGEKLLLNFFL